MSEREFENAVEALEVAQKRRDMVKAVWQSGAWKNATVVPTDMPMNRGLAAAVLSQIGFSKESAEMLRLPTEDEKGVPDLYDSTKISEDRPLFRGPPMIDPLFRPKELPPPTPAQIRDAIEDMEELTASFLMEFEAVLCEAKLSLSPLLFAKFATAVRAIELL